MNEEEKMNYITDLTDTIHTMYAEWETLLKELEKSIERIRDHHSNPDLVKVEAIKAL